MYEPDIGWKEACYNGAGQFCFCMENREKCKIYLILGNETSHAVNIKYLYEQLTGMFVAMLSFQKQPLCVRNEIG